MTLRTTRMGTVLRRGALLAAALALPSAAAASEQGAVVGEPHPEVRLPTIDGERTVALSDFRGKRVLLIEFASW